MQILDEALPEGRNFASAASRICDRYKPGAATLKDLEAQAEAAVDAAVAKAKDGLDACKAEAEKVEKHAEGDLGEATPVVDVSAGPTIHTAPDGTVMTLDQDAGTVTAKDGDGEPVAPAPAAVGAVMQATVDAGVAVPETKAKEPPLAPSI